MKIMIEDKEATKEDIEKLPMDIQIEILEYVFSEYEKFINKFKKAKRKYGIDNLIKKFEGKKKNEN